MSLFDFNDDTFLNSFEKVGFMDSSDCVFLGMFWVCCAYALGMFRVCFGYVLGMFFGCFWYGLGMCWVCFGYVLGMCWYVSNKFWISFG